MALITDRNVVGMAGRHQEVMGGKGQHIYSSDMETISASLTPDYQFDDITGKCGFP